MDFIYFLKGFIIGFSLPIPIGPAGILCIRRTIAYGKIHGILTGLSAAISDMIYSIIAAFGITFISNFISSHIKEFHLVGGIILILLGYRTSRSHSMKDLAIKQSLAPVLSFFSTFLVTFTNPMTVFAYAIVLASIGIGNKINDQTSILLIVAGAFTGSLSWYLILTYLSSYFKEGIISRGLPLVNRIAGYFLMLFGAIALWSGLSTF